MQENTYYNIQYNLFVSISKGKKIAKKPTMINQVVIKLILLLAKSAKRIRKSIVCDLLSIAFTTVSQSIHIRKLKKHGHRKIGLPSIFYKSLEHQFSTPHKALQVEMKMTVLDYSVFSVRTCEMQTEVHSLMAPSRTQFKTLQRTRSH